MGKQIIPCQYLRIFMALFIVLHAVCSQSAETKLTPCELESILRELTYPEEGYELHAEALRSQLRNLVEREGGLDAYPGLVDFDNSYENSLPYEEKRNYRSLLSGKRNVGALARSGLLRGATLDHIKRSIATLAKNGQLPSKEPDAEDDTSSTSTSWDEKRNIGSVLKSGFNGKRNIASLARKHDLPSIGKRNLQSLVRTGFLPNGSPKRSFQSLVRANALPHSDKRNIQTLARDWNIPNHPHKNDDSAQEKDNAKRNIQALKAHSYGRKKRELYYDETSDENQEILEPVYQSPPLDYEELVDAMSQAYPYVNTNDLHSEEKRYLGSVARSGSLNRFRALTKRKLSELYSYDDEDDEGDEDDDVDLADDGKDDDSSVIDQPQKRHIASLARSGWLPSFRPIRGGRFSRSGRARPNFTPDTSNFGNQSPAFVEDVRQDIEIPSAAADGALRAFHQRGVQHHPNSPLYTGEIIVNQLPEHDDLYSEQLNIEERCANRLKKLLFYLKKQYYYDNKLLNKYFNNIG